jgi:ParB family chromosome partitioning protein
MRKALGKGIAALLPSAEAVKEPLSKIATDKIKLNKYQARKDFNEEKLRELADSISEKGLLQPLIVSPEGDYYRLIAGERRLRAARLAKLDKIPAIIRKSSEEDMFELSLIENLQRENLNPIEEAEAYEKLMEKFNLTQEQVSHRVHKQRSVVANSLRLLNLAEDVKKAVSENKISAGHARSISSIKNIPEQLRLLTRILREKLTVREVEEMISGIKSAKRPGIKTKEKSAEFLHLEKKLRDALGTKVRINQKGKKGNISISWYSNEDLERIINIIVN